MEIWKNAFVDDPSFKKQRYETIFILLFSIVFEGCKIP